MNNYPPLTDHDVQNAIDEINDILYFREEMKNAISYDVFQSMVVDLSAE
jgi:hypothetical protein